MKKCQRKTTQTKADTKPKSFNERRSPRIQNLKKISYKISSSETSEDDSDKDINPCNRAIKWKNNSVKSVKKDTIECHVTLLPMSEYQLLLHGLKANDKSVIEPQLENSLIIHAW